MARARRPGAPRGLAVALYLLLLGGFAVAIWSSYRAAYPGPGLHRVIGIFEARAGANTILVRHEDIPGLMEAMPLMSFEVEAASRLDLAPLARGDRLRLTVRQQRDGTLLVVEIRKLP
ncbi:MAG: copper-binding protein [Candidatus Rokubacteria bacterium]|nr:copper-binding protein [Candidatus Rokubacteria bacterium]